MKYININVTNKQYTFLERLGKETGLSKAELVRRILDLGISRYQEIFDDESTKKRENKKCLHTTI